MYKTTQAIKSLANGGVSLGAGSSVTPGAFTPELWARLISDGVVVEVLPPAPEQPPEFPYAGDVEINATAGAIKLADAEGVNLHEVSGSGSNGRITLADVREAIENA